MLYSYIQYNNIQNNNINNIDQNSMDYPALDQVYDLSTQDLRKLQQRLQNNPNGHQQLLETVILQIQQRKALEYFAQLCHADNPYARKVAAFNQQFLKLAAQTIQKNHNARMQGISQYQPTQIAEVGHSQQLIRNKDNKKPAQDLQKQKLKQYTSTKSLNISSNDNIEYRQNTDNQSQANSTNNQTNSHSDAVSTTTNGSISRNNQQNSSRVTQVKMNLGAKKGGKGKMKQFMNNILTRTLVQEDGVIKRNNPNSPQTNLNPHKKYHIPGQKHQVQTKTKKNIQNPQQTSQKSIQNPKKVASSQRNKISSTKVVSNKAISQDPKKTKQIANKMKQQQKKGAIKLPKINQYKNLVDMVKQQQQKRKNKANKVQKLPHIQNNSQGSIAEVQPKNEGQKQQQKKQKGYNRQLEGIQNYDKQQQEHLQDQRQQDQSQIYQKRQLAHSQQHQARQSVKSESKIVENKSQYSKVRHTKSSVSQKLVNSNDVIQQEQNQMEDSLSPQKFHTKSNPNQTITNSLTNQQKNMAGNKTQLRQIHKNNQHQSRPNSSSITNQPVSSQQPQIHEQLKDTKNVIDANVKRESKTSIVSQLETKKQQSIQKHQDNFKNNGQNIKVESNVEIDYTKKLIQQIEKQQQNQYYFFNKNSEQQNNSAQNQVYITDTSSSSQNDSASKSQNLSQQSPNIKQINKKIYSEQYWAHIREEAQLKIKRFKQEKQYQQKKQSEKQRYVSQDSQLSQDSNDHDNENKQVSFTLNQKSFNKIKQEQAAFEKQIAAKNQQLNKLKKQMMKKTNKKVAQAVPVPKPIRPKPQFDYLSVYPTFNHIFSVMYLKPLNQALNDIPNIMRDIKSLFTTHIEHFSNKSNFKPAIFLPFDNNSTFQLTDPKQLIAHAQQTYIDLKVMIERVQMFNQNLHGQFNNSNDDRFYRVVKTKQEVYDIISTSFMRRKGWRQLPHGCSLRSSWNLFWSWSKPDIDLNKLLVWQKINHFPFNKNLSRKDLLYKNLDAFRKTYKVSMNFLPLTFNLPKQFSQLSAKFHQQQMINRDNNYWIMKPIGKSRGRGIKVVTSLSQLNYTDNIVVQKYLLNPMLIDGYKFDMRIYVLVTSFHPLQAFVYRQGFARLSTQKYTLDPNSIKNTFVHLTNFAINKNNVSSNTQFAGGSKISLKTLKDKITRMGHSFANIWSQVHDIIVKSLLGCSVSVPSFPTAFQLFGYDIMVDQQCNCHLIQINASPSLQRSYMIDQIVKQNLIDDIIDIVDPPDFDKKQLLEVFNERIQSITNKKKISADQDLVGLARILRYKPIRKIGQRPPKMGLFQVVAPCDTSRDLEIVIKAKSGANNPMNID